MILAGRMVRRQVNAELLLDEPDRNVALVSHVIQPLMVIGSTDSAVPWPRSVVHSAP